MVGSTPLHMDAAETLAAWWPLQALPTMPPHRSSARNDPATCVSWRPRDVRVLASRTVSQSACFPQTTVVEARTSARDPEPVLKTKDSPSCSKRLRCPNSCVRSE